MKKILFTISLVFAFTFCSISQSSLTLSNLQNCDLRVELFEYDINTCFLVSTVSHTITAGSVTLYNAAAGTEFIYAEIIPALNPACFPSSNPVTIETDGLGCGAVTCAGPGFPTMAVVPSTGCGCSNPITLQWDACASGSILFF
tara:strand:- start:1235 stop:1666 length:432 start_codon:yes stop_codon:yes gene_type:complete